MFLKTPRVWYRKLLNFKKKDNGYLFSEHSFFLKKKPQITFYTYRQHKNFQGFWPRFFRNHVFKNLSPQTFQYN